MRVLVCGGRDFDRQEVVDSFLDELLAEVDITLIIHGAARGADLLGASWAHRRGINVLAFPANWKKYGRSAGHVRNAQMLKDGNPDLVVAFPGGRGTAHMVNIAKAANIKVKEIKPCA